MQIVRCIYLNHEFDSILKAIKVKSIINIFYYISIYFKITFLFLFILKL